MLSSRQIDEFRRTGHLTVAGVLDEQQVALAIADITAWSREFLDTLSDADRRWYLEQGSGDQITLRKLDNPVFHRDFFRRLAADPSLVAMVEQLIGKGVTVFFSQVFMKPPGVGGPKPIHQDNFYFGPDDLDATLTVWIALDEATVDNGCLYYADVHQTEVVRHEAPEDEPFNLQIPTEAAADYEMRPAPVTRGGVSFHHGNTPHQSSHNRSPKPRRAVAIHYLSSTAQLVTPALPYDQSLRVQVT